MKHVELEVILNDYTRCLQAEKGLTAASAKAYSAVARGFGLLCLSGEAALYLPPDWGWEDTDRRVAESYLAWGRREKEWADSTARFQLAALSAFYDFLVDKNHRTTNPLESRKGQTPIHTPKAVQGDSMPIMHLLGQPSQSLAQARLALLVGLIYSAGVPPAHVFALTRLDMAPVSPTPDENTSLEATSTLDIAWPEGKATVPCTPTLRSRAQEYLAMRPQEAHAFWADGRGTAKNPTALGREISRWMSQVGLSGGPGKLRKLSAQHLRDQGADLRSIQGFLGQRTLHGVRTMASPDFRDILARYRQAHPGVKNPD